MDFVINWVFGLLPWWGWVILGAVVLLTIRHLVGSWKYTFMILSIFGAAAGLSRARKAGQRQAEARIRKQNEELRDEADRIKSKARNTSLGDVDRGNAEFVRKSRRP